MDITSALETAAFFARQEGDPIPEDIEAEAENGAENGGEAEMQPIIRSIDSLLAEADMGLDDLAHRIGATVLTPGPEGAKITRIYAGDRVSDLLNEASSTTLLVTNLANLQMLRVAELMEVPGVCFVEGVEPDKSRRRARLRKQDHADGLPRGRLRDLRAHLPTAGRTRAERRRRSRRLTADTRARG